MRPRRDRLRAVGVPLLVILAFGCEGRLGLEAADGSFETTTSPASASDSAVADGRVSSSPESDGGPSPDETDPEDGGVSEEDAAFPAASTCASGDDYIAPATSAYLARIKRLLSNAPLEEVELRAVRADPDALGQLILEWFDSPESDSRLQAFFTTAFQQDQFDTGDLTHQFGVRSELGIVPGVGDDTSLPTRARDWIAMSFRQSFGRTALRLVRQGRPFTETLTTNEFVMNTPMMVLLAWSDQALLHDGSLYYPDFQLETAIPEVEYVRERVSMLESLDPESPNFMRFAYPLEDCAAAFNIVTNRDGSNFERRYLERALGAMFGGFANYASRGCAHIYGARVEGMFARSEWEDWRTIRIRRPGPGEETDHFYEVSKFRTATELVLETPRVGFFSTPAFFAVWPTNVDNASRVTLNQTLIAGLGYTIVPPEASFPEFEDDPRDAAHAEPGTSCYGCHVVLDPMRNAFRREFTDQGYRQTDPEARALPALFALDHRDPPPVDSIESFGAYLATSPRFGAAWAQQLCYYATSRACPSNDPRFVAVVDAFENSGFDFRLLVRDLFSSSLITGVECVEEGGGDVAGIARRRHFCDLISTRLGIEDACFVHRSRARGRRSQNEVADLIESIPDDTYARGADEPLLLSDTNLFIHGAYERICTALVPEAVGEDRLMDPARPAAAVDAALEVLMGIPSLDPRYAALREVLSDHYDTALARSSPEEALGSVFITACLSPSVSGMGF